MAFSLDGRRVASAGTNGTTRIWSTAEGEKIASLQRYEEGALFVAFSHYEERVFLATDRRLRIWDYRSDSDHVFDSGQFSKIREASISGDGNRIATADSIGIVFLWNTASKKEIVRLFSSFSDIVSVALSSDGETLAAASTLLDTLVETPRRIDVWVSEKKVYALDPKEEGVWSLALSPNGQLLASGGERGRILLWDLTTGSLTGELAHHESDVMAVSISPNGRLIASGSADGTVIIRRLPE